MKKLIILLFLNFSISAFAQNGQHDWSLGKERSALTINTDETQVAYLTKERLSIFDVVSGYPMYSMALADLGIEKEAIDIKYFSNDLNHFILRFRDNTVAHLNAEKQTIGPYFKEFVNEKAFKGIDLKGREIYLTYSESIVNILDNGKLIHSIKNAEKFSLMQGGKFAFYLNGKDWFQLDLETLKVKELPQYKKHKINSNYSDYVYKWVVFSKKKEGKWYNPYTNSSKYQRVFSEIFEFPGLPACVKKDRAGVKFLTPKTQSYWRIQNDLNLFAYYPNQKYAPKQISKKSAMTCKTIHSIHPSIPDMEFAELHPEIKPDNVDVNKASQAIKKEVTTDESKFHKKNFFSRFKEKGIYQKINISQTKATSLKDSKIAKQIFGKYINQVYGYGILKECYNSKILLYLNESRYSSKIYAIRVSNDGTFWGEKLLVDIPVVNNRFNYKANISFTEFGNSVTAKVVTQYIGYGDVSKVPKTKKVYFNCDGKW